MNLKRLSSVAALLLFNATWPQPNTSTKQLAAAEQVQVLTRRRSFWPSKWKEKGSYTNFDWTYQNAVQTIDVDTPLGNTVGQLCQDSDGVLAVNSKE